ncbi:Leucine-rich repeat [Dillenia turbinata]|uniref:Leucine-rich repeat n=1 Tax=Dillenia turbinata TaxID=194707 RepID=A0AAN8W3X1_9MAGN
MTSLQFLKNFFLLQLCALALGDHQLSLEFNALNKLKAEFNDPFLNKNWTGFQCYLNEPSRWFGIECEGNRVKKISLPHMGLKGRIKTDLFYEFTELSVLSFKNNSIQGTIMDFTYNKKLKSIDLSSNRFEGFMPDSLLGLNMLESLQLQANLLSGQILEFDQPSLREFNVSYNNLSGRIPATKVIQSFSSSSFAGNPELCHSLSLALCAAAGIKLSLTTRGGVNDTAPPPPDSNKYGSGFAKTFLLFDAVGLIVVVLLFILYYRKAKNLKKEMIRKYFTEEKKLEENKSVQVIEQTPTVAQEEKGKLVFMEDEGDFELNDLLKASAEGLGKGNFGNCYKAVVGDGPVVVVKRLRDLKPLTHEEFLRNLQVIGNQKHPNLLPLIAYYCGKDEKLLIYKFAPRGNLFERIHGGKGKDRIPFRWNSRLSVARGIARALDCLHLNSKSQTIVPHGNLKPSNVLLDDNDVPLVSDYGLVSIIALPIAAQRMVSYKSPEYHSYQKISRKSDVWSYGCLLLELLTGRVSSHSAPPGVTGVDLCSWVHRAVREEWTAEIFDTEISVQRSAGAGMLKLLQIAIKCSDKSPERRPEMSEVVRAVDSLKAYESESEDEFSADRSLTDDSLSTTPKRVFSDNPDL